MKVRRRGPGETAEKGSLPYDEHDLESILRYAGRLTGRTLGDFVETEDLIIGDVRSKGKFGQIVESEFFMIPNNNFGEPDFREVGLELKVAPMKGGKDSLVSKERLVLGIIDYDEIPSRGFDMFLHKGSHILIVFYQWSEETDILSYPILKVVDWRPTEEELRLIREDWDVIEGYVLRGEAEKLSERHTKYLAANTKGTGHDSDLRSQPFSDVPAKQRSLSFKAPFMTALFHSHHDVNELFVDAPRDTDIEYMPDSVIDGTWTEGQTFEDYVESKLERFVGRTCIEIERMLGVEINESKQYYHTLTLAMFGVQGKKRIKEFDQARILIKTVRIKKNGRPKESMSFPTFRYGDIVNQTWETSDFHDQIDREFFMPVFQFNTDNPRDEGRKDLTFIGAFFWYVPDGDFDVIRDVWEETRDQIDRMDFDHFIGSSQGRIAHVRPHGRNKDDTYPFRGGRYTKRSFWFNDNYIRTVVRDGLDRLRSGKKG